MAHLRQSFLLIMYVKLWLHRILNSELNYITEIPGGLT